MNQIKHWLRFFEQVSCFHLHRFVIPLWNKWPNHASDIWESLAIFIEAYAFERQGRDPDYPQAGLDALLFCKQENIVFNQCVAYTIWQKFSQLLNGQGLNRKGNPLYPSGNPDNLTGISNMPSIIEAILLNNMLQKNLTLSSYLYNQILQSQDVQSSFELIRSIRGIGDKIASLYLRDFVVVMGVNLACIKNRQLLQPIDIWVRRTVEILSDNKQQAASNWIVDNSISYNINPERVNMGIWFFCSQIIMSEYKLGKTLADLNDARSLLNDYRNRLTNMCQYCVDVC